MSTLHDTFNILCACRSRDLLSPFDVTAAQERTLPVWSICTKLGSERLEHRGTRTDTDGRRAWRDIWTVGGGGSSARECVTHVPASSCPKREATGRCLWPQSSAAVVVSNNGKSTSRIRQFRLSFHPGGWLCGVPLILSTIYGFRRRFKNAQKPLSFSARWLTDLQFRPIPVAARSKA